MINLLDHIDRGGRVGLGTYITECSARGNPSIGFTYQIVNNGEPYTLILSTVIWGSSNHASVKCKSVGDISRVEIKELIEKYWDCLDAVKLNWEDIKILEPDEIIELYKINKGLLKV